MQSQSLERKGNMNIRIKFKSIRTHMVICFSYLVLFAVVIFMFFSIHYTKESVKELSIENNGQLIEQVNLNIENYIDTMENISQVIINNRNIKEYLFENNEIQGRERIGEEFQTVLHMRKDICNIIILGNNGRYFINDGKKQLNPYARLCEKEWYKDAKKAGVNIVISSSHVQNLVQNEYKWVVSLTRGIINQRTGMVEGILIIDLNYDVIKDLCESLRLGGNGYVYIVDKKGEIIYHDQQQLILSGLKHELLDEVVNRKGSFSVQSKQRGSKIYTPYHSLKTGWTIVLVGDTSELVRDENTIKVMYLGAALILVALVILISIFLAGSIIKPIKQLQTAMKEVQEGRFGKIKAETQGEEEIVVLIQSFNLMTEKVNELMKKNLAEQEEKQRSELKALQAQINPHFLYNTLDSIIWLIETNDADNAIQMTAFLARFFRQAIGSSSVFVPLNQELEYTRNYLRIQQMRYKDKVSFHIQVDEEILSGTIIKLVLQPLAENALYHGLKYKKGKGTILITGYRQGEEVRIQVMDNGIGMSQETLKHLFFDSQIPSGIKHNGVGIKNVQNRLQLYYGCKYGITVESMEKIGTIVTVVIPYQCMGVANEN